MRQTAHTTPTKRSSSASRVIVATATGNFVEWFDFGIYGLTVIVLADVFFPPEAGASAVLAALAVYGVAFVARPLSAFFFGWVGDRFGRRNALSLSILIMGVATACISPQCSFVASLALGR